MDYNGEEISEQEWSAADRADQTISARIEAGEKICEACMHHDGGYICKLLGHRGKPMKTCGWWNKPVIPPKRKVATDQEKFDRLIDRISEAHSLAFVGGEWVILRDKKRIKDILKSFYNQNGASKDNVFIATEADGSKWVRLEDYQAATEQKP